MQFERVIRSRTHIALALLLTASSLGVLGCKDSKSSTSPVLPYLITVTPPSANLAVGGTQQLTATVKDFYNNTMSTPVTWESSIPTVATVSATGLVTMVKSGSTTIVARVSPDNGQAYGVTVVSSPTEVASFAINPIGATLAIPTTSRLTTTALDASGGVLLPTVTYSSSAPNFVSVSATGVLTAVAAGSATITATAAGGKTATTTVTAIVFTPVNNVTFSPASGIVNVGSTQQLAAIVKDAAGNVLTDKTVVYASSAPTVATVSQAGLVTVVGGGFANITATSETKVGTFALTVPFAAGVTSVTAAGGSKVSTTYLANIPAGAKSIKVVLSGGTGDPDLFIYMPGVVQDASGNGAGAACGSGNDVGVTESCSVSDAPLTAGLWQIQVFGYAAYAGWTLTVTIVP